MKNSIKISGIPFNRVACSTSKTRAKKRAEGIRKEGYKARVIANGGKHCVYMGTKRKPPRKRRRR